MMLSRAFCAALLLLTGACANAELQTPHSRETHIIPLDLRGPRPVVQLTLSGRPPVRAVFDTGAMNTTVNIDRAASLGLVNEGSLRPPFDAAHATQGYQTTLRGAAISGLALPDLSVPVLPSPLPDAAAIISPNAFTGYWVTLDFARAELRIAPRETRAPSGVASGYSAPPFELPVLAVRIGRQTYEAHLDTGSPVGLIMPTMYAQRIPLQGEPQPAGMAHSHFGARPILQARIAGEVHVGPLTLQNPEVRFTDAVPNINVGVTLLRDMVITIDPEFRRVWAAPRAR